jgi:hypothetical protein
VLHSINGFFLFLLVYSLDIYSLLKALKVQNQEHKIISKQLEIHCVLYYF